MARRKMLRYRKNKERLTVLQEHNSKKLFEAAKIGDLEHMKHILHDDMVGIADFDYRLKNDYVVLFTTLTVWINACSQKVYDGCEIGTKALDGTVLLVDHGANIMSNIHFKSNAIIRAVETGMLDVAEYLIQMVSNLSIKTLNHIMFSCNSVEMLQLLRCHGADITSRREYGETILMKNNINEKSQRDIRRLALSCGVDVNAKCMGGSTALHEAAVYGDLPSVMDLCQAGASLDVKDEKGNTPLQTAILWANKHWRMRHDCEPPQTNFNGTVRFLREEPLRRHVEALQFLSVVIEHPENLGSEHDFNLLDRETQKTIMSMVHLVPARPDQD